MNAKKESPQANRHILRRTDIDGQLTQEVMERCLKQTLSLIGQVERKTPWRDTLGADDRIQNAILKTLEGTRTWDPARVDLGGHLFGVVKSDISSELKHGAKFARFSLDDDEDTHLDALRSEAEDALARDTPTADESPVPVWSLAIDALREVAANEPTVLRILDAYDQGAFAKRDVMRVARMKSKTYATAFAKLVELAKTIDEDTRDLIIQAIA